VTSYVVGVCRLRATLVTKDENKAGDSQSMLVLKRLCRMHCRQARTVSDNRIRSQLSPENSTS
jgi:hypothetical protein